MSLAVLAEEVEFDIPQQPVSTALTRFAEQARLTALFPLDLVRGRRANALTGRHEIHAGLSLMLQGTGLAGTVTDDGQLVIRAAVAPVPAGSQPSLEAVVEEVIVSARRRLENLQDVPLSIIAFGADDIERMTIENVEDLNVLLPNVNIRGDGVSASRGLFFVRGIPGVARYVDGVVHQDNAGALFNIVGLERIEVLRGPQGTLFGKNAIGGAIQYITRAPAPVLAGEVDVTIGELDRRDVTADLNLPVAERLFARLTAASLERDGHVRSLVAPVAHGDVDNEIVRAQLLWRPTAALQARFIAESNDVDQLQQANVLWGVIEEHPQVQAYNAAGMEFTDASHGFAAHNLYMNRSPYMGPGDLFDSSAATATIDWGPTDLLTLKAIVGAREFDWGSLQDHDASEYGYYEAYDWEEHREHSQELQLQRVGARSSWTVGLYYASAATRHRDVRWQYEETSPRPSNTVIVTETSDTAVFAESSFDLTPDLALITGIRYTVEDFENAIYTAAEPRPERLTITQSAAAGALFATQSSTFDSLTPRLALQYRFTDELMSYLSYSEGFNGGGVNDVPVNGVVIPYDEEELDLIELGVRSVVLGGRLRLNATYFRGDWEDIQVDEVIVPGEFTTRNAGGAEVEGLEVEATWRPTSRLTANLALGWLDAEYTQLGATSTITLDSILQLAPQSSYTLGFAYEWPLAARGQLGLRADYGWLDRHVTIRDDALQRVQSPFGLLSARLAYTPSDGTWDVALFGTNLNDVYYQLGGFAATLGGVDQGVVARPREVGVTVSMRF